MKSVEVEGAGSTAPRRRPWKTAIVSGLVVYAICATFIQVSTDSNTAFAMGQVSVPVAIGVVMAAFLASAQGWRSWWQVGCIVALTAGLLLTASLVQSEWGQQVTSPPERDVLAEVPDAAPTGAYTLNAPISVEGWRRVETRQTQRREAALREGIRDAPDDIQGGLELVYAEYAIKDRGKAAFLGGNLAGSLAVEARTEPGQTLVNFMAGMGAASPQQVSPGDLGGVMGCTTQLPRGASVSILCGWVDTSTVGLITFSEPSLDIDSAAALTRTLRGQATSN